MAITPYAEFWTEGFLKINIQYIKSLYHGSFRVGTGSFSIHYSEKVPIQTFFFSLTIYKGKFLFLYILQARGKIYPVCRKGEIISLQ